MKDVKNVLTAFSEEIRVRMAMLLWNSDICVNCLVYILDLPQSTISRHLSLMRTRGIVRVTKNRTNCYYTIEKGAPLGPLKQRLVKAYCSTLSDTEPFKGDLKRLKMAKRQCRADCKVRVRL